MSQFSETDNEGKKKTGVKIEKLNSKRKNETQEAMIREPGVKGTGN